MRLLTDGRFQVVLQAYPLGTLHQRRRMVVRLAWLKR